MSKLRPTLRPLDEIPEDAVLTVRRNAAILWLIDASGVEYLPPPWLCRLVDLCEEAGYVLAQSVMREALGIDDPAELPRIDVKVSPAASQAAAPAATPTQPASQPRTQWDDPSEKDGAR